MYITCAVIMAGGKEMRFGPKKYLGSKQAQKIDGREEIINETIIRCKSFTDMEHIYIVTSKEQERSIKNIIKNCADNDGFLTKNIFIEPEPKGTAACILYAAKRLQDKFPGREVIMCVFPADHDITESEPEKEKEKPDPAEPPIPKKTNFQSDIKKAIELASNNKKIITIGIEPTFPATGYGYIKYKKNDKTDYYSVEKFKEKPDDDTAYQYYRSPEKNYLWNSGIFIWDLKVITDLYKEIQEEMYKKIFNISSIEEDYNAPRHYSELEKVYKDKDFLPTVDSPTADSPTLSVDRAILEHPSAKKMVLKGTFKWDDIGKWDALLAIYSNDGIFKVDLICVDTANKTVYSSGKYVYGSQSETMKDIKNSTHKWLYCNKGQENAVLAILENYHLVNKNVKEFSSIGAEETKEKEKEYIYNLNMRVNSSTKIMIISIVAILSLIGLVCLIRLNKLYPIKIYPKEWWKYGFELASLLGLPIVFRPVRKIYKKLAHFIKVKIQQFYFNKYSFGLINFEDNFIENIAQAQRRSGAMSTDERSQSPAHK